MTGTLFTSAPPPAAPRPVLPAYGVARPAATVCQPGRLPPPRPPAVGAPTPDGPGPYHEAGAAIGVEISPQKLHREVRHRGCDCLPDLPEEHWHYCPVCGRGVWEVRVETIPEWDSSDPGRPLLAGLPVLTTPNPDTPGLAATPLGREVIRQGVRLVVGEVVVRTSEDSPARRADLPDDATQASLRERLRAKLEPLGLWDGRTFGLWAVHHRVG